MNVKCIRFLSAENIVADLVEETDDYITIRDAIVAMPIEDGSKVGFAPFAPLQDPNESELTIPKNMVMYITKVAPNLEEQYNSMFQRIVAPNKKIIV
jgi:hypothetical protein|tara:strand:+ start:1299 stop:1589 length:291 start_codon:yes stop_codon:yes gene_type:complete